MQAFAFQPVHHESGFFRFEWIKACLRHDLSPHVETAQLVASDQIPHPLNLVPRVFSLLRSRERTLGTRLPPTMNSPVIKCRVPGKTSFKAVIIIHEYIYSHSTTDFTFKKYNYSHLTMYLLFTIIFTHIYKMSSFTFNALYSFTVTIQIFIQHFLRTFFAHR